MVLGRSDLSIEEKRVSRNAIQIEFDGIQATVESVCVFSISQKPFIPKYFLYKKISANPCQLQRGEKRITLKKKKKYSLKEGDKITLLVDLHPLVLRSNEDSSKKRKTEHNFVLEKKGSDASKLENKPKVKRNDLADDGATQEIQNYGEFDGRVPAESKQKDAENIEKNVQENSLEALLSIKKPAGEKEGNLIDSEEFLVDQKESLNKKANKSEENNAENNSRENKPKKRVLPPFISNAKTDNKKNDKNEGKKMSRQSSKAKETAVEPKKEAKPEKKPKKEAKPEKKRKQKAKKKDQDLEDLGEDVDDISEDEHGLEKRSEEEYDLEFDDRLECQYGSTCYRKNPHHFIDEKHSHIEDSKSNMFSTLSMLFPHEKKARFEELHNKFKGRFDLMVNKLFEEDEM